MSFNWTKRLLGFGFIFLLTATANAQSVFYLKGALGPSVQSDSSFMGDDVEFDPSGIGTFLFAFGVSVGPMISTEIELSGRNVDIYKVGGVRTYGDLSSSTIMLNGIFNLPLQMGYSLNFGAGFGVLSAELEDDFGNFADGSTLGMQLMIGGEAQVTDNMAVTLEYRRLTDFNLELSGTDGAFSEDLDYKNHSILMGIKYYF